MSSRPKKLSKEEKLTRKKQLAEEKRLKKIEDDKQNLRNELKREQSYTQQSRRTLDDHWEKICGEITRKDLLESLNCHRQNIEMAFDVKEEAIERMNRWREEASIQHKRLFEGHLTVIEYLMRIHKYFTESMKKTYESTIRDLLMDFNEDSDHKTKILKDKEEFYEKRLHANNIFLDAKYQREKLQHDNKKLEIEFEAIDCRNKLQTTADSNIIKIQNQIRAILNVFYQTSANPKRMKIYEKLKKGDQEAMQDLNQLKIEREKCEQELVLLNNKLIDVETNVGQKLMRLMHERKTLETTYWTMKEKTLKKSIKIDETQLREVAMMGNNALKRLQKIAKHGDSLLKMSLICAKLEHPQEKLFFMFHNTNEKPSNMLENFFAKVSKVRYSRDLIKAEKKKLLTENSHLQKLVREYCIRLKVTQNLTMLGCSSKKPISKKSKIVAQEASSLPQIKAAVLKSKRR